MITKFWWGLRTWLDRRGVWRIIYRTEHVTDLPDRLKQDRVYVVGEDGYDWSAAMLCPGGCGKTLEMNLLPDAKPVWRVSKDAGDVASLHPSVWLKTGCACHFVLTRGRVRWV
jgi:hypothetical protein